MKATALTVILALILSATAFAAGASADDSALSLPSTAKFFVRPSADTTGSDFKGMGARNTTYGLDKALKAALTKANLLAEEKDGNYAIKTSIVQYNSDNMDNAMGAGGDASRMITVTRVNNPDGNTLGKVQSRVTMSSSGPDMALYNQVAEDIVSQLKQAMGLAK